MWLPVLGRYSEPGVLSEGFRKEAPDIVLWEQKRIRSRSVAWNSNMTDWYQEGRRN